MIFTGIFCELLCILPCGKIFHLTRKEEFNLKKIYFLLLTQKDTKKLPRAKTRAASLACLTLNSRATFDINAQNPNRQKMPCQEQERFSDRSKFQKRGSPVLYICKFCK